MKKCVTFLESSLVSKFVASQTSLNTGHDDYINDVKTDYFGTKLATASSDKTVRIFSVDCRTGAYHKLAELTGYNGPVLQLAWSHPNLGSFLATASYDGRVIVWKNNVNASESERNDSKWGSVFDSQLHETSVNAVAWAAVEFGTLLVAGSSDGSLSILSMDDKQFWFSEKIPKAHELGCTDVSWSFNEKRFASGGNDYTVKIWGFSRSREWILESTLKAHTDWVCSVDWSPISDILVSTGRDGRIFLWTKNEEPESPEWNHSQSINQSHSHININVSNMESDDWKLQMLQKLDGGIKPYVSWDPMGTFLCVSDSENEVYLWKQSNSGTKWEMVSKPTVTNSKLSSLSFN